MTDTQNVQAAERFDPGATLATGIRIYFKNFVGFTALALIVFSPILIALGLLVTSDMNLQTTEGVKAANSNIQTYTFFNLFASVVLNPILTAALIYGVVQQLRGSPATLGASISMGFARMLPALGVGIGLGFMVGLGIVACVVPGFWLLCTYWPAVAVAVMEPGGASFDRAKKLTDGLRWKIFSVVFVLFAVQFGVNYAITHFVLTDMTNAASIKERFVVLEVMGLVLSVWNATTAAVGYYEIRRIKEGIDIAQLAAVFD